MPIRHPFGGKPLDWQPTEDWLDVRFCDISGVVHSPAAATLVCLQIVRQCIRHRVGSFMGRKFSSCLPCLADEVCPRSLLPLRKRKNGEAVRLAGVVRGAQGLVVLAPGLVPEAGNPAASFRSAAVAERATFGNHRPIGLAPDSQARSRRPSIDLAIANCASHAC